MGTTVFTAQDVGEAPRVIAPTQRATFGIAAMATRWGSNKVPIIDKLVGDLRELQSIVINVINQTNKMKNKISSNVSAINGGEIRIIDSPGDIVTTNRDINAAISIGSDLNIPEMLSLQRAMALGGQVRDLGPIQSFDSGRGDQISAKMTQEVVEADSLRTTINTIIALLKEEKGKP